MAEHWYCGHCRYGPMMVATTEHCLNCLRRRDLYSTYERSEQSRIASMAPSYQLDPLSGRTKCSGRGITDCQHESESLAAMPAEYFVSAASWWYCCRCLDGPKYGVTEVKCLECQHEICPDCTRSR